MILPVKYNERLFVVLFFIIIDSFAYAQQKDTLGFLKGFDELEVLKSVSEKLSPAELEYYLNCSKQVYIEKKTGTYQRAFNPNQSNKYSNTVQSAGCNNVDFEMGNLTGWSGRYGVHYNFWTAGPKCLPSQSPVCPNNGFIVGRHTIMSGNGFDPFVGPSLKKVAPGGSFSLRLGNSNVFGECDQIEQTFTVSNTYFSYKYALVFQSPAGHDSTEQPFFLAEAFITSTGQPITCAKNKIVSDTSSSLFNTTVFNNVPIVWKQWTTVTIDLAAYMGQDVTIRFTTSDCSPSTVVGGHFGYAYIDCSCNSQMIVQQDTVCPGEQTILKAPDGFLKYEWAPTGDTTQVASLLNVGTHTVTMTSEQNCISKATYDIAEYIAPNANFSFVELDIENTVQFTDISSVATGSIVSWAWDFGDGTTSTDTSPQHFFMGNGYFNVKLVVSTENNCQDSITQELLIGSRTFYVPNAITPNDDGKNDVFTPKAVGLVDFSMKIYDRWGNEVFSSTDINNSWNGSMKNNGNLLQTDVYVWKVRYKDIFGEEFEKLGHVALIR